MSGISFYPTSKRGVLISGYWSTQARYYSSSTSGFPLASQLIRIAIKRPVGHNVRLTYLSAWIKSRGVRLARSQENSRLMIPYRYPGNDIRR